MGQRTRSGWWWKGLSVLLLLFVVIVGLRTPLAPAIMARSVDHLAPGEVTVDIWGYNTHFTVAGTQASMENGGESLCARAVKAVADDHLVATFLVPAEMDSAMSDLCVTNPADGRMIFPNAFYMDVHGQGAHLDACSPPAMPTAGFRFPDRNILNESIRNLFFHVPMWFAMMTLAGIALWMSVKVLRTGDLASDRAALAAVQVGLLFCALGLITGSMWARVTWETWWTTDVKLNGAAVGALVYLAYLVLRGSVVDPAKRARLAAIYNIFAFVFFMLFIMVLPRLNAVGSLHPGNGGNPAFSTYDLDSRLRLVFYPACIGWIGVGVWLFGLRRRLLDLHEHLSHAFDR